MLVTLSWHRYDAADIVNFVAGDYGKHDWGGVTWASSLSVALLRRHATGSKALCMVRVQLPFVATPPEAVEEPRLWMFIPGMLCF